jgi:hypothetical protein
MTTRKRVEDKAEYHGREFAEVIDRRTRRKQGGPVLKTHPNPPL